MSNKRSRRAFLVAVCAGLALAAGVSNAVAFAPPPRAAMTRRLQKWRCTNQDCEPYIYDPSEGAENIEDADNPIPPGVAFEELPDNWVCPVCGDTKEAFQPLGEWVVATLEI